jgi:hypothetical protein
MRKNKSKPMAILGAVLLLASISQAQSIYFSFKDGTQAAYNINEVRNITFTGDVMNLTKTDGTAIAWNVSTIGIYRYEEGTVGISEIKNTAELLIYPNPAQGKVNISYQLPVSEQVSIGIFDLQGKAVQTWASEDKPAGKHELVWQAENLPKGSYILRFSTAKGSFSKTIILR